MPLFSFTVFSQHKHAHEQPDTDYIANYKGMSYALKFLINDALLLWLLYNNKIC